MFTILFHVRLLICAILLVGLGVFIGQWANLPMSEWEKLESLPFGQCFAKSVRWTYWSIRRFFAKMSRSYPYND